MATAAPLDLEECALCLTVYQDPRFLPCYHTFCAQCISRLASLATTVTFPCPVCRTPTTLPAGGAQALQANFYIKKTDKSKKKDVKHIRCSKHKEKKIKSYCSRCQEYLCSFCKLLKHEGHHTVDLNTIACMKKISLQIRQKEMEQAVADVMEDAEISDRDQQDVWRKAAALKRDIRDRHATMVAAADQTRDEALESLDSVLADIGDNIAQRSQQRQDNLQQLLEIQLRLQNALSTDCDNDVIRIDQEMTDGRGSKESVEKLTSVKLDVISRPVLRPATTVDDVVKTSRDYLGAVCRMELESGQAEMRVEEKFRAGQGPNVEVFSLCPVDEDPPVVWVSYERRGVAKDAPVEKYRETGDLVMTDSKVGLVSHKRFSEGWCMSLPTLTSLRRTYCKSLSGNHWRVDNFLNGKADVDIVSNNPFQKTSRSQFTIKVGDHRAADMDDTERFLVIVEEAQPPDVRRNVRMYQPPAQDPVTTYSPPTHPFHPSDVCFYTLGGEHVLLVTDQANDVIHVVNVEEGGMTFLRYLVPDCPSLIQPTAINVDVSGQLWVACRGGHIVALQPKDS